MRDRLTTAALLAALAAATGLPATAQTAAPTAAAAPAEAAADPVAAGKKLYRTRTCAACHGVKGDKAILDYPVIAGLGAEYALRQMLDIKSGARVSGIDPGNGAPRSQGMKDIMHLVGEADMANLAAFIASLPPPKPTPPEDASRVEAGAAAYDELGCASCHGDGGAEPADVIYPALAGQKRAYLFNQMIEMREGVRVNANVEMMADFVKAASLEQLEAIADYLAQVAR